MNKSMLSTEGQLVASPRRRAALGLAGTLAAGALALGLTLGGVAVPASYADETGGTSGSAVAMVDEDTSLAETVANKVLPSVGSVYVLVDNGYQQGISQGSCEVLSSDGYLLTNYHVIEGATEVQVTLNGTAYEAEIVGSDPTSDLAVLKIDPGDTQLTPIEIGDSSAVNIGEWVMTVGTPYGESGSVAAGIVSGVDRTTIVELDSTEAYYVGLIQTDAMINSGSSGGALVNADGQLIGVTTISATQSGDWAGMSYAIPSNYAINIANQIINNGEVQHPQLGVSVSSLMDAYYQGAYAMPGDASSMLGAYVAGVVQGSGAEAAGVQVGDVITAVDGTEVYSADDVIIQVRSHAIGDTVTLTVNRDGQTMDLDVVLGSDNEDAAAADNQADQADNAGDQVGNSGDQGDQAGDTDGQDGQSGDQGEPGWGSWIWGWGSDGSGADQGSQDGGPSDGGYGPGWGYFPGWGGWQAGNAQQIGEVA